jgi:hypothetical protein
MKSIYEEDNSLPNGEKIISVTHRKDMLLAVTDIGNLYEVKRYHNDDNTGSCLVKIKLKMV